MDKQIVKEIRKRKQLLEEKLSIYATKSNEAIYLNEVKKDEYETRLEFNKDTHKILYSLSYSRYTGKTQVYSNLANDMITVRSTHVQFVSHIARNIARMLNLNEDLCEAIALGHDLGHTPFGHTGEKILDKISKEKIGKSFNHNIHSVRTLTTIENKGKGLNISLQVLDGIMCHNGELLLDEYRPNLNKTKDKFLKEYNDSYVDSSVIKKMIPMTLEGCIVRVSDIIAYLGKDIEDAIRLNRFSIDNLSLEIKESLGTTNSEIISNITADIISNSYNKGYIKMSNKMFNLVKKTLDSNYENIYKKANTKEDLIKYEKMFYNLYEMYIIILENNRVKNEIYIDFLNDKCDKYLNEISNHQKVIDYLAGMTDRYFMDKYEKYEVIFKEKEFNNKIDNIVK